MLRNLHIKNLALIREIDVDFSEGLNILTGETGAGKSIIIDSIGMALGGKASRDMLREDAPYGLVEMVFEVGSAEVLSDLRNMDIEPEEGIVLISRKIQDGRSSCRINGVTRTVQEVRECASFLLDIHGQSEHQKLLHPDRQLMLLDEYGKDTVFPARMQVREDYKKYAAIKKELGHVELSEEERNRRVSFLEFEIDEIQSAGLVPGEDDELEKTYRKLSNSRRILEAAGKTHELTGYDSDSGAGETIGRAIRELDNVCEYDTDLEEMRNSLSDIDGMLNDFNRDISEYLEHLGFEEESFEKTEERLNLINHLKSKYGHSVPDILHLCEEKKKELDSLRDYEEIRRQRLKELGAAEESLKKSCTLLSSERRKTAVKFTEEVKKQLSELNFAKADFAIEFHELPDYSANGSDALDFMISTNPGEPRRVLSHVVSGGELSRIMLGIKTMFAASDSADTMIFDEIDAGISGRTAQKVAEKMAVISKKRQVLCITHLPQIAAMADTHYGITKELAADSAITRIEALNEKESVDELARLIGGAEITDNTIKSAYEMKEMCRQYKKNVL